MPFPLAGAALLRPVVALNAWTFIMEIWMYKERIPAMSKYKVKVSPNMTKSDMDGKFPGPVRWPAENYNHLLEQPTQFYAVAIVLAMLAPDDRTNLMLAWAYVGVRVLHSIWHASRNVILPRFYMFAVSSMILAVMTGRAAMLLI